MKIQHTKYPIQYFNEFYLIEQECSDNHLFASYMLLVKRFMTLINKIIFMLYSKKIWDILNNCFPPYELRTYWGQQDVIKLSEYHTKLFKKGTKTFGLLAWWDFNWCIFLEYFCIKDRFRGMGYSYDLFTFIFSMRKLLILEVDKTNNRLLNFYQSRGFVLNDNYIYKPIDLSLNCTNNNNLALMSYPRKISKSEFECFVSEQINPKYNQYRK